MFKLMIQRECPFAKTKSLYNGDKDQNGNVFISMQMFGALRVKKDIMSNVQASRYFEHSADI